jgi:hypothetical protein
MMDVRQGSKRREAFYRVLMPALVLVNLALGVFNLALASQPQTWVAWSLLAIGVFSCVLSGWLAGAWWLRCYWSTAMTRQAELWRRVVDTVFGWTEEVPVPTDALVRLKRRIDRVLAGS